MSRRLRRLLLASTCLAMSSGGLAACGDGEADSGAQILAQTFRHVDSASLRDGYLSLSVRVVPRGPRAVRDAITFTLLGPFRAGPGGHDRFDVEIATTTADRTSVATVRSTGTRIVVTRASGTDRVAGALPRSWLARRAGGALPVIGLDPSRWIRAAQAGRHERAAGVATLRVAGTVDVARLLADVRGLLADARPAPLVSSLAARAAESSSIDIWTGAADRVLRQLAARITFSARPGSPRGARLDVHLRLDDVNQMAAGAGGSAGGTASR